MTDLCGRSAARGVTCIEDNNKTGKALTDDLVNAFPVCCDKLLFIKISAKQSFKGGTVAGFIFTHFMNGVVNGVKIKLLCFFGQS